jgi:hypothetical protein
LVYGQPYSYQKQLKMARIVIAARALRVIKIALSKRAKE